VKCSVFLSDAKDFGAMNEVYAEVFGAAQARPHYGRGGHGSRGHEGGDRLRCLPAPAGLGFRLPLGLDGKLQIPPLRYPGFPVGGVGELHAAFSKESRTSWPPLIEPRDPGTLRWTHASSEKAYRHYRWGRRYRPCDRSALRQGVVIALPSWIRTARAQNRRLMRRASRVRRERWPCLRCHRRSAGGAGLRAYP
jgi:hypothetical protein